MQEIIKGLKEKILDICNSVEPGKNNVIIPFSDVIAKCLPKEKASDMTLANRFFGFLTLLAIVNIDKRPRLVLRREGSIQLQTMPFALFADLQETIFLMEYANGVRPYTLDWYYDVFLETYNAKTEPDSKVVVGKGGDITINEARVAVTTQDLIEATSETVNRHGQTLNLDIVLQTRPAPSPSPQSQQPSLLPPLLPP